MIEVVAISYEGALRQSGLDQEVVYESCIPDKANSAIWIQRLQRINRNIGMTPRLRGLHGEVKIRYGKLLIEDYNNCKSGYIVMELSGAELKRYKEENGYKWSRQKVFRFLTLK